MLAHYLELHMRQRRAPMVFVDADEAEASRASVVAQAQRFLSAVKKQTTGMNAQHGMAYMSRCRRCGVSMAEMSGEE